MRTINFLLYDCIIIVRKRKPKYEVSYVEYELAVPPGKPTVDDAEYAEIKRKTICCIIIHIDFAL